MKRILSAAFVASTLLAAGGALADEQTIALKVDNLFCASCPYIVKQTLSRVPGVNEVKVSFQKKTAIVTFDDQKTDAAALTAATSGIGFPSTVIE